jgi:hypothetical protein
MNVIGLEWIGTRTGAYDATTAFFRDVLGLPAGVLRPNFVRFDLPDGGSLEVFRPGGEYDHPYFATGPVIGLQVADFDLARADLGNAGLGLLGEVGGEVGGCRWQHFRGPDGCVYEIVDDPDRVRVATPVGPGRVTGFGWVGVRSTQHDAMRRLVAETLRLATEEEAPDFVEFRFPGGDTFELFRPGGPNDHPHLVTGPVPGFLVEDLDVAESELRRHGIERLARRRDGTAGWSHFRAPDGNVYEIKHRQAERR